MIDLTQYNIKDLYTGKVLRPSTPEGLTEWLEKSYTTLTEGQREMIRCLEESFKLEDAYGIKWYGAACDLAITPKKTRRKKK